jgi:hypothetical protein
MTDTNIYQFSPESIDHARHSLWLMIGLTAVLSALLYRALGRRACWLIPFAALLIPMALLIAAGADPREILDVRMLEEAVLPLTIAVGVPSALAGMLIGICLRKAMRLRA